MCKADPEAKGAQFCKKVEVENIEASQNLDTTFDY